MCVWPSLSGLLFYAIPSSVNTIWWLSWGWKAAGMGSSRGWSPHPAWEEGFVQNVLWWFVFTEDCSCTVSSVIPFHLVQKQLRWHCLQWGVAGRRPSSSLITDNCQREALLESCFGWSGWRQGPQSLLCARCVEKSCSKALLWKGGALYWGLHLLPCWRRPSELQTEITSFEFSHSRELSGRVLRSFHVCFLPPLKY